MAGFWRKSLLRKRVLARDNFACRYCGVRIEQAELTLDHVIPVAKGGKHTYANLVTACKPCNLAKGSDHTKLPLNWTKITWWLG